MIYISYLIKKNELFYVVRNVLPWHPTEFSRQIPGTSFPADFRCAIHFWGKSNWTRARNKSTSKHWIAVTDEKGIIFVWVCIAMFWKSCQMSLRRQESLRTSKGHSRSWRRASGAKHMRRLGSASMGLFDDQCSRQTMFLWMLNKWLMKPKLHTSYQ